MNDLTQARKLIKDCKDTQNPYLDLGRCGITDLNELPELFKCNHLETLILSNEWRRDEKWIESRNKGKDNEISSITSEIPKLKKLTKLIIYGGIFTIWKISDIRFLENLTGLQTLDLSNNQISDIRFLENLRGLQTLDLSNNQISDLRFLENLTGLQTLDLRYNQISDIRFLENLTGLQTLYLDSNQISDIRFLENLTGLQTLYLSNNQISDIRFLENLTGLQTLYLSNNQISDLRFLENLTGLQTLDLNSNKISDIRFLENLTGLQTLDLRNNKLKEISLSIFRLKMEIDMHEHSISGLSLYGNTIESPPLEIIKQGKKSVLDWFAAKKGKLNEIKIILIGEPGAGKTSLLKRLKNNTFNPTNEPPTDGVNIEDIAFGMCDTFKEQTSLRDITGHFWDFGGQEIMNATHQFFLTKRSIYVLVLDARIDKNNASQIRNWVMRIRATGGNSPIIVLANQIDINPGFGFENERELQKEFPQIKHFIKVSCSTNKNINLFKEMLAELVPTAELFQTKIDERWIKLKEKLQEETQEKYFLNQSRYWQICNEVNLKKEREQENAICFLHDLGQALHFEDLNLSEYYELNPYWITYGAYQILTSTFAGNNKGIVGMDKLKFIVNEEKDKNNIYYPANYKKIIYSTNEQRFLLDILCQFKLCFCVKDSHFIIPDLLDTTEPLDITNPIRLSKERTQFIYEYEYLPKSVMPNIMVETHPLIKSMWRTGCVLNYDGCKALVTSYQNRISFIVTGEQKRRDFMAAIIFIIDSINQKLSNKPVPKIPLSDEKSYDVIGYVDYDVLLTRERKGKIDYIFDEDKPTEKTFFISELLNGIPRKEEIINNDAKFENILTQLKILIGGQGVIINSIEQLNSQYEHLLAHQSNNITKDDIQELIKEINAQQKDTKEAIITSINEILDAFYDKVNDKLDNDLKKIYNDIKGIKQKTDGDVQMKLKLSISFINLLGNLFNVDLDSLSSLINLDIEFNKNWIKKYYEKYKLRY